MSRSCARFAAVACAAVWPVAVGVAPPAAAFCPFSRSSDLPPPAVEPLRSYRASFHAPARLAVDDLGRIYASDPQRGRVVVRAADGRIVSVGDALGYPVSLAATAAGERLYVGDGVKGSVTAYDGAWQALLQLGAGDGEFAFPSDLAVDRDGGEVWVVDSRDHRIKVYDAAGRPLRDFGGRGDGDGEFRFPMGIYLDPVHDEVLVTDQGNGRVQIFDRQGRFVACFGRLGGGRGRLSVAQGIWVDAAGRIYVADAFQSWVQVLDRQGGFVAAIGGFALTPGGLRTPTDLVIDPAGRLVVSAAGKGTLELYGLDAFSDPERFVPAEVAIEPAMVELPADGELRARLEVPGYPLEDLEPATVSANGVPADPASAVIEDRDGDAVPELVVRFDLAALAPTLPAVGPAEVRLRGRIGELEIDGRGRFEVVPAPPGDGDGDDGGDSDGGDSDGGDSDGGDSDGGGGDPCAGAPPGEPVDAGGCSLDQLCPCAGPRSGGRWKNHGQYVSCVARASRDFVSQGLMSRADAVRRIRGAARSDCGERPRGGG